MEDSKKYIQQAVVSIGSNLCDEEKKFLQTRTQMIKKSLETALGMSLQDNQVPRIALCASGGGNRAMLTTLGALDGGTIPNTSLNIMDICTYFSTLSGSTWALTGLEYSKMPPGDFIDHLAQHMYQGILDDFNMQDLVLELKKKEMNNQPTSFVNVYGILLAQKILKGLGADHPSAIELTCCTAIFDEAKMPLSIKTSVIGNNDLNEWTE
ncbi:MAG: hypothetical protein P4L31_00915, partial [Candidatus Babeliales bacterium]|nr:hypothetical protein [Candidatus Babeliales bacterium]